MPTPNVVLITGASSGIGEALAREYIKQGANVALAARRTDRLDILCKEFNASAKRAIAITADVTRDGAMEEAVAQTVAAFGDITVLVANAGGGIMGHFARLSLEAYRSQLDLNVLGVLRAVYAAFESLQRSKGSVVVVSSVMAYLPLPAASAYNVSKAAEKALAESLRVDLAPYGVNVTHVAPGFINTELRRVDAKGHKAADGTDPVPLWLQMSAPVAARKIIRATRWRRGELVLTNVGKLTVFLSRHFPGFTRFVLTRVARKPRE